MKSSFQDIIPPENRSIKKIPIPARRQDSVLVPQKIEDTRQRTFPFIRVLIIAVVALGIVVGVFVWMTDHSQARVIITPQDQTVTVNGDFTASASATSTTPLHFQTITVTRDGKLTVPAGGQESTTTKASGTIVIYNAYSSAAQKLIAGTRFESPQGLIFRINQPVIVPGSSIRAGKTVPGSVEAIVTADAVGADYNVGLTDFTIPGFKGDPKYSKFYGRSKTPIQGGFSGTMSIVDPTVRASAVSKIQTELGSALITEVQKDIPVGFIMPNDAYSINYTQGTDTPVTSGAELSEEGSIQAIIFNRQELAIVLSEITNPIPNMNVDIGSITNLGFSVKGATSTALASQNLAFSLAGTAVISPIINTTELQMDLVGKPRTSLNAIVASYPGILKANLSIQPFWQQSFPSQLSKINIMIASSTPH